MLTIKELKKGQLIMSNNVFSEHSNHVYIRFMLCLYVCSFVFCYFLLYA